MSVIVAGMNFNPLSQHHEFFHIKKSSFYAQFTSNVNVVEFITGRKVSDGEQTLILWEAETEAAQVDVKKTYQNVGGSLKILLSNMLSEPGVQHHDLPNWLQSTAIDAKQVLLFLVLASNDGVSASKLQISLTKELQPLYSICNLKKPIVYTKDALIQQKRAVVEP